MCSLPVAARQQLDERGHLVGARPARLDVRAANGLQLDELLDRGLVDAARGRQHGLEAEVAHAARGQQVGEQRTAETR